jgi:hypothetical protein
MTNVSHITHGKEGRGGKAPGGGHIPEVIDAEQRYGTKRLCSACGTAGRAGDAASFVWYGDAYFCTGCWTHLPADEIARVVDEIALRGVPFS